MTSNKWEITAAEKFCLKVTDGTHDSPKRVNYGKKLITSKHLDEFRLDFENAYLISEDDYKKINLRSQVDQYDILFSMIGTVGTIYLEKSKEIQYAVKNVGIFKSKSQLDAKWLYYYLKSSNSKKYIHANLNGSTQQYITLGALRKLPILNPDNQLKEFVVDILSSLDDKIEVNNKINSNLEELAQALYKRWFVDFEFPNEEGKPHKSSGGEMVESELGLIPKGWEVLHLDKLFSFERGVEPGSKNYSSVKLPGYVPFIRVGDLESKSNNYVSLDLIKDKTCMEEDVLVSFDGAVGRVAMGHEGAYSTGIRKIQSFVEDIDFCFIYLLFKSQFIQDQIQSYANGTTIMHAGSSIKHLIAPLNINLIAEFSLTIRPMIKQRLNNMKQNESLALTRDLLLPKLMSGEIEV